jgi:Family of unknown function (DUF5701)
MSALSATAAPTDAELEFDRQVDALVQSGMPGLLEAREECFRAMLEPLRDLLPAAAGADEHIPFVVVVPTAPVRPLLTAVHTPDGEGGTLLADDELARFRPLPELALPATPYLLLDVDPGAGSAGTPPGEADARLRAAGRSPLTVAEGLAVLVSDCGVLRSGDCFALLGCSSGGSRVPALWTGSEGPVLGCWDKDVPEPRLGAASCGGRRAA